LDGLNKTKKNTSWFKFICWYFVAWRWSECFVFGCSTCCWIWWW